jgi:hypothetical protein
MTLSSVLLLGLPIAPELVSAFSNKKETETIEEDARDSDVALEYGVANREPNGNQNYA